MLILEELLPILLANTKYSNNTKKLQLCVTKQILK